MQEFADSLLLVFAKAQVKQIGHWLLNYQLYAVVTGLVVLSFIVPVYRWTRQTTVSLAHDYFYGIFHTLITFPVLAVCAFLLKDATDEWIPWINLNLYAYAPGVLQVLAAVLINDFLKFISHYLRHKIRPLWHFHTIHHSQENLNPFTTKRTHIVESLFGIFCISWIPLAVMGSPAEVWVAYYLFSAVWDYFVHSNLRISLGPLKYVLVSPLYHRLHHSSERRHFDKNFADQFVIWDILFRTADFDFKKDHPTGVPAVPFAHEHSAHPWHIIETFGRQWIYPFKMIYKDFKESWSARTRA